MWKQILEYPNYSVSDEGMIMNIKTGRILKTNRSKGYDYVSLRNDKEVKRIRVHRVVASAFIPNPYNLPTVNHKDLNKQNNNVSNLEWMSYADNNRHSMEKQGRRITETFLRSSSKNRKKGQEARSKKVALMENGEVIKVFPSINRACKEMHISQHTIAKSENWKVIGI